MQKIQQNFTKIYLKICIKKIQKICAKIFKKIAKFLI